MNKNRLILAVSGGVIGLAVLAMAYLTWSASSAKNAAWSGDDEEGTDGLETVQAKAQTLSRKSIYPCAASVKAIDANTAHLAEWTTAAAKLAARGDRPIRKLTAAQFKTELVSDAKRLAALPGAVNGVLVKPDFAFGPFRPYIVEGKMPAETELVCLQRRWDDITTVVEALAASGIAELVNVEFKAMAEDDGDEPKNKDKKAKSKSKAKAKGKANAKAAGEGEGAKEPVDYSYVFTFTARPVAFVKVVNALTKNERFVTLTDFALTRSSDPVGEALGGAVKKEASAPTGRRRGRRGGSVAVEAPKPEADESKNGIVTDPALDAPFTVALTLTVSDFRTMEEDVPSEEKAK